MRRACVFVAAALCASPGWAADHLDGTAVMADPSADLTDLYAWTSPDGARVNLVLAVFPMADKASSKFSTTVKYVFHLKSWSAYGPKAHLKGARDIVCTFDATQKISCWLVDRNAADKVLEYVTGDAGQVTGLTSSDGHFSVFAGPRDDPFFFNLDGFRDLAASISATNGNFTYDPYGCPQLQKVDADFNAGLLSHSKAGKAAPADFFAGQNVLAIAVTVDAKLVAVPGGPYLAAWASTNK